MLFVKTNPHTATPAVTSVPQQEDNSLNTTNSFTIQSANDISDMTAADFIQTSNLVFRKISPSEAEVISLTPEAQNIINLIISIPSTIENCTITRIAPNAFCNSPIQTIYIGPNIKEIGDSAFSNCFHLETVKIMASELTKLGDGCFKCTPCLRHIEFTNTTIQELPRSCFEDSGLKSIVWPKKLKRIREACFKNTKFRTLKLPRSLEKFDSESFAQITELENFSVEDQSSLYNGAANAFNGCTSLKNIEIDNCEFLLMNAHIFFKDSAVSPTELFGFTYFFRTLISIAPDPESKFYTLMIRDGTYAIAADACKKAYKNVITENREFNTIEIPNSVKVIHKNALLRENDAQFFSKRLNNDGIIANIPSTNTLIPLKVIYHGTAAQWMDIMKIHGDHRYHTLVVSTDASFIDYI